MAAKPLSAEDAAALAQRRKQPERAEQRAIVQLLRSIGASVYVLGTTRRKGDHPGTMQTPGIPDLYVHWPGRVTTFGFAMWIEVKAPKGRLSEAQKQFQAECRDTDGITHLVGGLDAVIAWCKTNGKLK